MVVSHCWPTGRPVGFQGGVVLQFDAHRRRGHYNVKARIDVRAICAWPKLDVLNLTSLAAYGFDINLEQFYLHMFFQTITNSRMYGLNSMGTVRLVWLDSSIINHNVFLIIFRQAWNRPAALWSKIFNLWGASVSRFVWPFRIWTTRRGYNCNHMLLAK